jgi:hypothetical protein
MKVVKLWDEMTHFKVDLPVSASGPVYRIKLAFEDIIQSWMYLTRRLQEEFWLTTLTAKEITWAQQDWDFRSFLPDPETSS